MDNGDDKTTAGRNLWAKLPVNKPLLPSHLSLLPTATPAGEGKNNASPNSRVSFYQMSGLVKEKPQGYFDSNGPAAKMKEPGMSMSREEIDAKLQLNEARLDTKVAQLDGKIDRLTDLITNLRADIDRQTSASARDFSEVKEELKTSKSDNRFTRWTIVVTAVTSVIAVVGLVIAVQSSLLSAFQAGTAAKPATTTQSATPDAK